MFSHHFKLSALISICICLITTGCSEDAQPDSFDEIDFKLELTLLHEIDEFPVPDQNFYFPQITALRAFGENEFLITDNWLKKILHINRNGKLIRTIGREGRGPGEFTNLWTVIPLRDRRIGVSNLGDARTIIFDADGSPVMHHKKQPEDPYITGKVYPLSNGGYITANHRQFSEHNDCIFVELDQDLVPQTPCYGSYTALNGSGVRFLRFSGRNSPFGDMHFIEDDRFIFVRRNYDGTHYFYRRTDQDWLQDRTVTGYTEIPASVTEMPDTPSNRKKGNWVRLEYPDEQAMFVIIHNQSLGYEKLDGQYILHFTVTEQDGERIPGVELLTSDGRYLGYQSLESVHDQYGFNSHDFRIRAFNDGRLLVGTSFALYIFDVALTFSGR